MNITNLQSMTKDLEKYKSLTSSLEVAKASSLSSTAKMLGITSMLKSNESFLKAIDRNSVFGSHISSMQSVAKAYEAAIRPFTDTKAHWLSQSQEIQKSINSMLKPFGLSQVSSFASTAKMLGISSMVHDNESFLKAIDRNSIWESQINSIQSMAKDYEAAIKPFTDTKAHWLSQSQEIQKSIDSMLKPFGLSQVSSFASTAKMLGISSMIHDNESFLKAIDRNSIWCNPLKHIDLQNKLTNIISTSHEDLLEKMMISMQDQPVAVLNADYIPSEVELIQATEIFYEESDQASFIDKFNKLPAYLQAFIMYIVMSFLIPITNNIAANLLTPIVQEALEDLYKNDTDKIRTIQKSPSKISNTKINTSHLRFITAKNGLHVRSNPSITKSKIKDTIHLGQIVEVLDKRKNWIKISYKKEDKVIKGWVFTRYTKRFDP